MIEVFIYEESLIIITANNKYLGQIRGLLSEDMEVKESKNSAGNTELTVKGNKGSLYKLLFLLSYDFEMIVC